MIYRCLKDTGKLNLLKEFARQRYGTGYTPLEQYFMQFYQENNNTYAN